MKKFPLWIITGLLASGCTSANVPSEEPRETSAAEIDRSEGVWAVKPGMDIDNFKTMKQFDYAEISTGEGKPALIEMNKSGYPQEWYEGSGYGANAIVVEKDGNHGIYDFDGREIFPITVSVHSAPRAGGISVARIPEGENGHQIVYGYADTSTSEAYYFSKDYQEVISVPYNDFGFDAYNTDSEWGHFVIQNDQFGVAVMDYDENGKAKYSYHFEPWTGGALDDMSIVPVVDEHFKREDYAVCDKNGHVLSSVVTMGMSYAPGSFANGYYQVADGTQMAYVRASDGSQIGLNYHQGKDFSDGYAPVKRYGKWAFINEDGEEVTDYIFDDASTLVNGRAYVRFNDEYGILDLKKSVETGTAVNMSSCMPSVEDEQLGTIESLIGDLNIRSGAGTGNASAGNTVTGMVYPYYETAEAEGYTWYRIDEEHWIPDDGDWLKVTKK